MSVALLIRITEKLLRSKSNLSYILIEKSFLYDALLNFFD